MPFIKGQSGNPGGRVGVPTEMATHQCWNARFIRARLAAHWSAAEAVFHLRLRRCRRVRVGALLASTPATAISGSWSSKLLTGSRHSFKPGRNTPPDRFGHRPCGGR